MATFPDDPRGWFTNTPPTRGRGGLMPASTRGARTVRSTVRTIPSRLNHKFYTVQQFSDGYGGLQSRNCASTLEEAEVVSSEVTVLEASCTHNDCDRHMREYDLHAPVLDIDVPATLVPSTTEDHHHLYIDVPMTWRQYKKLLRVMQECGILERGFVKASIKRRGTHVRLPWVKKETVGARR